MNRAICTLAFTLGATVMSTPAVAAGIVGGTATYGFRNEFVSEFPSISPNTGQPNPFYPDPANQGNPDAPAIQIEVAYDGVLTEVWEDQVGNSIDFEIVDVSGEGQLIDGTSFLIRGGQSVPFLDPFLGSLTNIEQDMNDPGFPTGDPSSLQSAFRRAAGQFVQVLNPGGPGEIVFYGDSPYAFESTIDSLPYNVGQPLFGTADSRVNIRWLLGTTPSPDDPIVAVALPNGVVEITSIVPEPATLLVAGVLAALGGTRRRLLC